mmetsp:Transcript_36147/g.81241  ORF Transcript_36147/g.81241 Transcript_36147/m.81241 type:complete len:320 (-) Transcript_36147:374-1333(-)
MGPMINIYMLWWCYCAGQIHVIDSIDLDIPSVARNPSYIWDGKLIDAERENRCEYTFIPVKGSEGYIQCLREYDDSQSNFMKGIIKNKPERTNPRMWKDCHDLLRLWNHVAIPMHGDIFVDVGANIGACTMMMASHGIHTESFEPNPANLFYLTRTLAKNPDINSRVKLHPFGLGNSTQVYPIYMQDKNAGNSVIGVPHHAKKLAAFNVAVHRLDDVWPVGPGPRIRVMKIDAQGFEVNVFRGAVRLLLSGRVACIKFEVALTWLKAQGTSAEELFDILNMVNASIFTLGHSLVPLKQVPLHLNSMDLIACIGPMKSQK